MGGNLHQRGAGPAGRGTPAETVHTLPHVSVENEDKSEVEVNAMSEIFVGSRKIKPTDKPRVHSFPATESRRASIQDSEDWRQRVGGSVSWTGFWNIGAKVKAGGCAATG